MHSCQLCNSAAAFCHVLDARSASPFWYPIRSVYEILISHAVELPVSRLSDLLRFDPRKQCSSRKQCNRFEAATCHWMNFNFFNFAFIFWQRVIPWTSYARSPFLSGFEFEIQTFASFLKAMAHQKSFFYKQFFDLLPSKFTLICILLSRASFFQVRAMASRHLSNCFSR